MSLESQIADLVTATNTLTGAVNVSKATLDQKVASASTSAATATTKASEAVTKADAAAGSAASALAIYGNTEAMQTAVAQAAAQASVAAGHAASASSVVQQDLSGVNAAALHRSPNAVTAMFVYDTSKDSDGGAWTEKCQHTSWYNEAINGKWLGAQASEAAARAVSGATTGDYFQLTTDGKFYKLNAASGTTETFRGNKADFPRLSAIVAEGSSLSNERQNIVIYDLTEPGHPMWMSFYGDVYNTKFVSGGRVPAVYALNGALFAGNNYGGPYYGGLRAANFPGDWMHRWSGLYGNNGRSVATLKDRNSNLVGFPFGGGSLGTTSPYPGGDVAAGDVNAIAMTVLPDAPVDPVTGLQVPTIAVATGGGVSVIKHNGVVVNSSVVGNFTNLAIVGTTLFGRISQSAGTWYYAPVSLGALASGFTMQAMGGQFSAEWGNIKPSGKNVQASVGSGSRINTMRLNRADATKSSVASIADSYNIGWVTGDIRRAYLGDTGAGSVSNTPELVSNGSFSSADGWTFSGNAVFDTDRARFTAGGTLIQVMPWATGKSYYAKFDIVETLTGTLTVYFGGAPIATFSAGSSGTKAVAGIRGGFNNELNFTVAAGGSGVIDNISVCELVVLDRVYREGNYKSGGAVVSGTLTKSAVASAAQLVACSGFSSTNYLRESYSADLDFGVGEWNASAWVNVPVTLSDANFPAVSVPMTMNTAEWTKGTGWSAPSASSFSCNGSQAAASDLSWGSANRVPSNPAAVRRWTITVTAVNGILAVYPNNGSPFTITTPGTYYGYGDVLSNWGIAILRMNAAGQTCSGTLVIDDLLPSQIADRGFSSGPSVKVGCTRFGRLFATAYDGTTSRTVTTPAAYNTASWLKAEACYTTDGTLSIRVNGQQVAATYGAPLLTLNNANAVLTIGNSYALDAPFPGSIALLKLGATVPTAEQSVWMYEQEKQMFREGAQVCLPDSGSIVDLTYDDATDKWIAVSATNESEWSGLVRTSVKAVPAGSFSKVTATSGVKLEARTTANPGVDITIPAYGLREELVKRAESAARMSRNLTTFDYVGGFTANTTTGSTSITSVAGLSYPVSHIGAQVTGTGIPTGTVITAVNGTTIYLSKAVTATGTAVQISFTDFTLPVGYEAKAVLLDGVVKKEGNTSDFTRLFDGFKETIRIAVTPSYTAKIQIQATRSNA